MSAARRHSPRLVARVLGFSFAVIVLVLAAVFFVFSWQARASFTRIVTENLEVSQQRFGELEARRRSERLSQAAMLVENPTLKAAVDTYQSELHAGGPVDQLAGTLRGELEKMQHAMGVTALSVTDADGEIVATAGPLATDWAPGAVLAPRTWTTPAPVEAVMARGRRVYLTTVVPLILGADVIGEFVISAPLDDAYARALAADAHAEVVVLRRGQAIAGTASPRLIAALEGKPLADTGTIEVDRDDYVVRRLTTVDDVSVYAIGSVGGAARATVAEASSSLALVGLGALVLAALGSAWLARTVSRPIDELTVTLSRMARERRFDDALAPAGVIRELDALTETFDTLRQSVRTAEAESEATYLGVIGTLAAALDARDRYTAGHSERVAQLSVTIGQRLELSEHELATLRIGALLHDIGKIGVPDAVLRKPGRLTAEEFAQIELHPGIGARILKPLQFLPAVVEIVELHHEQPDGSGYPHGLRGDAIPLVAAIVHVADAFDAITSARAYRPGRPVADAVTELRRHSGTGFEPRVVQALTSLPFATLEAATGTLPGDAVDQAFGRGAILPFKVQLDAGDARRSVGR